MVSNLPFTNVGKLVGFLAKWFAIANWVVQFHVNDDWYESYRLAQVGKTVRSLNWIMLLNFLSSQNY
ncbi:hypothetical protein MTR_2g036063 [Medicago truncatula]|uniref:Uncharacterized protein n=1 Tax=Medicago truncatula TaxID=3880 RepID=A0A072VGX9_MEDTR|nr:hypothetical protein MTR_2g036063 [Medicago truncatula]